MDILSNLKYAKGSRKNPKRIGRGEGSGHGGTATKGMNGQLSRSGAKKKAWFEGGQMPLQRRVPKVGFTHIFKKNYQVVNVDDLQKLSEKVKETKIDASVLKKNGLVRKDSDPIKILGKGELKAKLQIEASAFTNSAKEKIEAVGGTIKKI